MTDEGEVRVENGNGDDEQVQQQPQEDGVYLTSEQYDALMSRLDELEASANQRVVSLDQLVREAKADYSDYDFSPRGEEVDIDSMSNTELVNFIFDKANSIIRDLTVKVETMRVMREVDKCEAKYEDFWQYKDDIYAIASQNPYLSIEDAYKLAKTKRGEQPKPKAKEYRRELLRHLPPRSAPKTETRVSASATQSSVPETLREAAMKAWEDIMGDKK